MEDHAQAAGECRLPPELDDLTLIAAIDGEAAAEVMTHLRDCPHCAARAHQFAELQGLLRKQFFRLFCPASDMLAAFHQGMLASDRQAAVLAHIADCPYCSREIQLLSEILGDALSGRSPPGPWGILQATTADRRCGLSLTAASGRLRRIVAELLTPATAQIAGAYGAPRGHAHSSQYAYHAENLQITIGVRPLAHQADRRVVVGVLEIEDDDILFDFGPATASLLQRETPISTVELDELGNFVLDDLSPGTYRLALRLPDREVIIEALAL